jgi:MFS family permease
MTTYVLIEYIVREDGRVSPWPRSNHALSQAATQRASSVTVGSNERSGIGRRRYANQPDSGFPLMPLSNRHSVIIALIVASAYFMENLDATVIATALPHMASTFGVTPVSLSIGMTAYLLALAVFIPISGWVADRFGQRSVFGSAIVVFTAASILCGLSNGLVGFTVARILQGMGGAMMVPVGRLAVLRSTEKRHLMRSIAYITWPGLAAPVIGPALGGFISTYFSWRWIFLLNVPIGLLGLALTAIFIPNSRESNRRPFDVRGFLLSGVALTCLMYGMERVGQLHGDWRITIAALACGVLAAVLALRHFQRAEHPLIDLSSWRIPTFRVTLDGGSLYVVSVSVSPFLLPLLFQLGFGARLRGWQSGHEDRHHAHPQTFWLSQRDDRQRPAQRRRHRTVQRAVAGHAARADHTRAAGRRTLSIDAVHQHQHARIRGRTSGADEFGQHFFQHGAADDHRPRHRIWCNRPACRSPDSRQPRAAYAG